MKSLSDSQLVRLRGLIARALDDASTEGEKNTSALAVCRLLAAEGLGVDGGEGIGVSIGEIDSPTPIRVVYERYYSSNTAPYEIPVRDPEFGRR